MGKISRITGVCEGILTPLMDSVAVIKAIFSRMFWELGYFSSFIWNPNRMELIIP
jgi:hypothetical protein